MESKSRIARLLREATGVAGRTVRVHPVELALALYGCAGCILGRELDWGPELWARMGPVPVFFLLALALRVFGGRGPWRRVYRVCWTPLVPLTLWSGLEAWCATTQFLVTAFVLAPLLPLLARCAADNRRFVNDGVVWLRSAVLAELLAGIVQALFGVILFSAVYIFRIAGDWPYDVWADVALACHLLLAPWLFLASVDRSLGGEVTGSRLLDVLLNRIVTPALLIYLGILWLYILRIAVLWELPRGGVAYMVFGFTIFAFAVKALQELLVRRPFAWFFDRFSLFALPSLVLFWVGVCRRIGEYGLTESRVWLVLCGALMTSALLLFLSRRAGRYLWVCAAVFAGFAVFSYVPVLDPGRIALRSQTDRLVCSAQRLGLLADGRPAVRTFTEADSVLRDDIVRFHRALGYVGARDSTAYVRFGMTEEAFVRSLPAALAAAVHGDCCDTEVVSAYITVPPRVVKVGGYERLYADLQHIWHELLPDERGYAFRDGTLTINLECGGPVIRIEAAELLAQQLRRAGLAPDAGFDAMEAAAEQLLLYESERLTIGFAAWSLDREEERPVLDGVEVSFVLVR